MSGQRRQYCTSWACDWTGCGIAHTLSERPLFGCLRMVVASTYPHSFHQLNSLPDIGCKVQRPGLWFQVWNLKIFFQKNTRTSNKPMQQLHQHEATLHENSVLPGGNRPPNENRLRGERCPECYGRLVVKDRIWCFCPEVPGGFSTKDSFTLRHHSPMKW